MPFPTITKDHAKIWTNFWNNTVKPYIDNISSGGDALSLLRSFLQLGRVAGDDYFGLDAGKPTPPASPSGTVWIPNGVWYVRGQYVEIDDPDDGISLVVELNHPDGLYYYLDVETVDLGGGEEAKTLIVHEAHATLQPALRAAGYPNLGLVKSDDATVTEIVATDADVIPTLAAIVAKIKSLVGGGGGGGDVSQAEFDALEERVNDLTAQIAALETQLGRNVVGVSNRSPIAAFNIARLIACVVTLNAPFARRFNASIDMPGSTGNGQDWGDSTAPVVLIGGNAVYDHQSGSIHGL